MALMDDLSEFLLHLPALYPPLLLKKAKVEHEEYYCVSICQAYIWSSKGKVFQLMNYPHPIPNQNLIFNKISAIPGQILVNLLKINDILF
jgi:hypothetical protein